MATLIVHPESKEKLDALKAFMKALKINFEEDKTSYNKSFFEKIDKSDDEFKAGKFKAIKTADLWK